MKHGILGFSSTAARCVVLVLGVLAGLGLIASFGCQNKSQYDQTISFLEKGKASGEVILNSNGRVSVSESIHFGIGPESSGVSFSGRINFSDPPENGEVPAGNTDRQNE